MKLIEIIISIMIGLLNSGCAAPESSGSGAGTSDVTEVSQMEITIDVRGNKLTAALADSTAAKELAEKLEAEPVTVLLNEYGGFEKVGALGFSLPTDNSHITTQAGDVILYNGDNIVLFYGSNSWSYTRLGRIKYSSLSELKSFLKAGGGEISVTLSL